MTVGYCPTCTNLLCPTPSVQKKPDGNCSHWTGSKPVRESKAIARDPKQDFFKGIPDGSTLTRRLDQCPKCSGHMDTLTCSDCGFEFELEITA